MKISTLFISGLALILMPLDVYQQSADTITIAPYGNSITQAAGDHQSYRYPLWKKLIDAGIPFDFVGSMRTNYGGDPSRPDYQGKSFDKDHEGHWGWRADQIVNEMDAWLTKYTPDIVLLHIGSNDCIQKQNKNSTLQEIEQIVAKLRNDNPEVVIFLSNLIPCNIASNAVNDLNSEIEALVDKLTTDSSAVIFVDQNSGINAGADLYDGIHPSPVGEEKMAQQWFEAIETWLTTTRLRKKSPFSISRSTPDAAFVKSTASVYKSMLLMRNNQLPGNGFITNLSGKRITASGESGMRKCGLYLVFDNKDSYMKKKR